MAYGPWRGAIQVAGNCELGSLWSIAAWNLWLAPGELTHSACTPGCSHKKAIKGLLMGLELFSY